MTFNWQRKSDERRSERTLALPEPGPADEMGPGAEPVGQVTDTAREEQRLLHCIRLWMEGPDYQAAIWNTLAVDLGTAEARRVLRAFEAYMTNIAVSISRKLYRHAPACPCLGRDEAILLTIVRHAGVGDAFTAAAHASNLVRDDRVSPVVDAAALLGAAITAGPRSLDTPLRPAGAVVH